VTYLTVLFEILLTIYYLQCTTGTMQWNAARRKKSPTTCYQGTFL